MSTDFERDVSAALHRAAGQLTLPRLDLDVIRRGGRRRRRVSLAAAAVAATVLAAAATIGLQHLPSAPAQLGVRPSGSPSRPSPTPSASDRQPTPTPAVSSIRAFYSGYQTAREHGQVAIDALIGAHVARWYAPIVEAPAQYGYAPDCFAAGQYADLGYASAGLFGGQAIIVVSSPDTAGQVAYAVVMADPDTGKITGIACTLSGAGITGSAAGSIESVTFSDYQGYLTLRRHGASAQGAVAQIVSSGGIESGGYLGELQHAAVWPELTYDPLLCTSGDLPDIFTRSVTVVAGGSAVLVLLTTAAGHPIVAVSALGAKGWAIFGVACQQP